MKETAMSTDLNKLGVFASEDVVPKEITIGEETVTVYVRVLPSIELDRFYEEARDPDLNVRVNSLPRVLAKAIRQEDGRAHFSVEQAGKMKVKFRREFVRVFQEVNKTPAEGDSGNA
jgi:hypothetical protein